jgi:hypothetical protein
MPEHAATIQQLFVRHSVSVKLKSQIEFQAGYPVFFSPEASPGLAAILWSPIMFTLMWVLSHGAWEAMRDFGSVIIAALQSGMQEISGKEIESQAARLEAGDRSLVAVDCAVRIGQGEELPIPSWIPNISDAQNIEQEAVRELWFIAISWMLMHEFQHIFFAAEGIEFNSLLDEEIACDKAAFKWLIADSDSYAHSKKQAADKVLGKRAMGALVGLFCIAWLSGQDKSVTHPPAATRLGLLLDEIGDRPAAHFWSFAAGLIYILVPDRDTVALNGSSSARAAVLSLAQGLPL